MIQRRCPGGGLTEVRVKHKDPSDLEEVVPEYVILGEVVWDMVKDVGV